MEEVFKACQKNGSLPLVGEYSKRRRERSRGESGAVEKIRDSSASCLGWKNRMGGELNGVG